MARELNFDGYWEGNAVYSCDNCGKERRFRFDSDEIDSKGHRETLRREEGWITTRVNNEWKDFCCESCRNAYIRRNTL